MEVNHFRCAEQTRRRLPLAGSRQRAGHTTKRIHLRPQVVEPVRELQAELIVGQRRAMIALGTRDIAKTRKGMAGPGVACAWRIAQFLLLVERPLEPLPVSYTHLRANETVLD